VYKVNEALMGPMAYKENLVTQACKDCPGLMVPMENLAQTVWLVKRELTEVMAEMVKRETRD